MMIIQGLVDSSQNLKKRVEYRLLLKSLPQPAVERQLMPWECEEIIKLCFLRKLLAEVAALEMPLLLQ